MSQGGMQDQPLLVGVYAGREGVTADENEMALGRVWHKAFVDEIFYQGIPGSLADQTGK